MKYVASLIIIAFFSFLPYDWGKFNMYSRRPQNKMLLEGRDYDELKACIDQYLYHRSFNDDAHPIFYHTKSLERYLMCYELCEN